MHFNNREEIIALTPQWTGERLPDGRPKVADRYLDALADMTLEEVWKPIFVKGYESVHCHENAASRIQRGWQPQ